MICAMNPARSGVDWLVLWNDFKADVEEPDQAECLTCHVRHDRHGRECDMGRRFFAWKRQKALNQSRLRDYAVEWVDAHGEIIETALYRRLTVGEALAAAGLRATNDELCNAASVTVREAAL